MVYDQNVKMVKKNEFKSHKTSFWLILQTSESKLFVVVDVDKTPFSVVGIATFETIFLLISNLLEVVAVGVEITCVVVDGVD